MAYETNLESLYLDLPVFSLTSFNPMQTANLLKMAHTEQDHAPMEMGASLQLTTYTQMHPHEGTISLLQPHA